MKTLDEVIEKLEHPSRAVFERDGMLIIYVDDLADALHYLKEYRRVRSQPDNCCIDDYDKPMWNPKDHWE